MEVVTVLCDPTTLQLEIQTLKNAGRRILAISPSKMKKTSSRKTEFDVTEYIVVAQ